MANALNKFDRLEHRKRSPRFIHSDAPAARRESIRLPASPARRHNSVGERAGNAKRGATPCNAKRGRTPCNAPPPSESARQEPSAIDDFYSDEQRMIRDAAREFAA